MESQGVDAYVWNGIEADSKEGLQRALAKTAETGKPVYAQPGSHEPMLWWESVLADMRNRHPNIVDTTKMPIRDADGHRIIFLPGSDIQSGVYDPELQDILPGQYYLSSDRKPGVFLETQKGSRQITNTTQLVRVLQHPRLRKQLANVTDINSIDYLCTDEEKNITPQKTIVISHIPAYSLADANGADYAYFASDNQGHIRPAQPIVDVIRALIGNSPESMLTYHAWKIGYTLQHDNIGNKPLREALERNGITRSISSHVHEAGHHAHDFSGNPVKGGVYTNDLAHNTGNVGDGQAAIYTVKSTDNEIKMNYTNINV